MAVDIIARAMAARAGSGGGSSAVAESGYYYNGSFYKDEQHTTLIAPKEGGIYFDKTGKELYGYDGSNFNAIPSGNKPYLSLDRESRYLYDVTFLNLPEYVETEQPLGMCSSYVSDGKLFRTLDWDYSNLASFHVYTSEFEGTAFLRGLTDTELDDELVGQLPYHVVDGVNEHGIMVSTHVLYNDWEASGDGDIPLTMLPYLVLSRVKSMESISEDISDVFENMYIPQSMADSEYLIQVLVSDGEETYVITPKASTSLQYTLINIDENPKLTNFKWVEDATVDRADLQDRPTGVERWNMMPCPLEDLRFTKCYEEPTRLSEFIGIDGTTKDSTDEELEAIYELARAEYLDRERDGTTWQTMHSVVYSPNGMEHLWIQENWDKDYATAEIDLSGYQTRDIVDEDNYFSDKTVEGALAELGEFKDDTDESGELAVDSEPTEDSSNLVTSGGVYAAIKLVADEVDGINELLGSGVIE